MSTTSNLISYNSNAETAEEFRAEVVNYFKLRRDRMIAKANLGTGSEKKACQVLLDEYIYQINFWSRVGIPNNDS